MNHTQNQVSESELEAYLQAATEAARTAGEFILSRARTVGSVRMKGGVSPVTEVDAEAERIIRTALLDRFPAHRLLGEEESAEGRVPGVASGDFLWIVDPIDGTKNFIRGLPHYAVSIALARDGVPLVGVVHEPNRPETFWAVAGGGAFLNGEPLKVSGTTELKSAMVCSGFSRSNWSHFDLYSAMRSTCLRRCQALRRSGSSALDLCYVAAARFDAFWQFGLNAWDIAAGVLIVREAGGRASNIHGNTHNLFESSLVSSNGPVEQELLELLRGPMSAEHLQEL